jgi:hypothetical protein
MKHRSVALRSQSSKKKDGPIQKSAEYGVVDGSDSITNAIKKYHHLKTSKSNHEHSLSSSTVVATCDAVKDKKKKHRSIVHYKSRSSKKKEGPIRKSYKRRRGNLRKRRCWND